MSTLPQVDDPNLLVGYAGSDDAGVYRLTDDLAIVMTADFITPPVDDPYLYGQVAAANALSDVYAMGGRPLACLNLVCFPAKKLPMEVLNRIVAGALSKITEAGAVLAGGHSIDDDEPKFGLSVTGLVHPEKIWRNSGAMAGDALILTKPIGSGVLFNANLKKMVSGQALDACLAALTTLNRQAAEVMQAFEIHAATDITGFGLAGHALEMVKGSGVGLEIGLDRLPILPEALDMYRQGVTTGVNPYNRQLVEPRARFDAAVPAWHQEIVFDPQTSGGLLAAVPAGQADELVAELRAKGVDAARIIGRVVELEGATHLVFK